LDRWQEKNEMSPLKTHFDQIPVARVKQIAEPLPKSDESETNGVNAPPAHNGGSPAQDGWRGVAHQIQKETDAAKMIELVQQLISKFDEDEQRRNLARGEVTQIRSGSQTTRR